MSRKLFIISLLILSLLLSSCSGIGGQNPNSNPKTENYYQGSEGIRMIVEPGAPPSRLYYYGNAQGPEYNGFDISVVLRNVGASWTRGGLYVSGYDPSLINVDGMNIPRTLGGFFDHCQLDFSSFSFTNFESISGLIGCTFGDDGGGYLGTDGFGLDNLIDAFCNILTTSECEGLPELDIAYDWSTGAFNMDLSGFSLNFIHHGRGLLMILDQVSFDRFNGKSFLLAPDNYNYPGGESTVISFPSEIKTWPAGLDSTDVTFLFTTCYAYSTYAAPIVCIDPDPYSETAKACVPGSVQMSRSQGGPVAITGVSQESTPRSVIFNIDVANVGDGKVINPLHLELCSPYYPGRLGAQDLDIVFIGDIRMSGSPFKLRCSPDNYVIRMINGRGQFTCTYDMEYATAKSAYKAPLIIELWYGYSESQRRDVRIKRAG